MFDKVRASAMEKMRNIMGHIFSSKPHFDFIQAHYIWIVTTTFIGSVAIYADRGSPLAYVDALLFASGSSTQGGLNPVDVNLLSRFQQAIMYIFPMLTNPIIIHASVVLLRLYWFEKRFQTVVKDAKKRRVPLSKTKSKARGDDDPLRRAEAGVNIADITRVEGEAKRARVANDGTIIVKDDDSETESNKDKEMEEKPRRRSEDSDKTLAAPTKWRWYGGHAEPSEDRPPTPPHRRQRQRPLRMQSHHSVEDSREKAGDHDSASTTPATTPAPTPAIIFTLADDPKTEDDSDGPTPMRNLVPHRRHTEHIAILERQRRPTHDDVVLRIPTPQEAERGLGPQTVGRHIPSHNKPEQPRRSSLASRLDPSGPGARNTRRRATVTIAEPAARTMGGHGDDEDDVQGISHETVHFRRPRFHHEGHHQRHHHHFDAFRKFSLSTNNNNKSENDSEGQQQQQQQQHLQPPPLRRSSQIPQRPPCGPRSRTLDTIRTAISGYEGEHEMPYLSYEPTVGRNSNFIGLNLEQREELGGIEYRSLKTLVYILVSYYVGFQLLGAFLLLPYILHTHYGQAVTAVGVSRPWWAFWTASGGFNDVGFALNPDSMIPFQGSSYILIFMSFFIIIGNAGFPVMLRFIIWVTSKLVPKGTGLWEELQFLLDHPRRCFTLLFPSNANWWLLIMLVLLNFVDVVFFIILDLNSGIVQDLPVGSRIVNGLFMAASTRTAGFASLPLTELHPAMPVLYIIMMYIGVYPVAISIRRTNVYEEKSLGIYESGIYEDETLLDPDHANTSPMSYVGNHLRRQLSFDLWFVCLGFFLLAVCEGPKVKQGRFDLFAIMFETISAYGTVGLSMGVTGVNASMCSQFSVVGKLIVVALQIRGRHRGLPYGLDRAVILPSESRSFSDNDLIPDDELFHDDDAVTSSAMPPGGGFPRYGSVHSRRVSAYTHRRMSTYSAHRRASVMSTHRRRSSVAIIGQLLHPGPSVPPGVVHSSHHHAQSHLAHRRGSRPQDHMLAPRGATRGWPSVSWHPPAVMEEDDEYNDDVLTPLTPQSGHHLRLAQTLSPTSTPSTSTPSTCTPPTR